MAMNESFYITPMEQATVYNNYNENAINPDYNLDVSVKSLIINGNNADIQPPKQEIKYLPQGKQQKNIDEDHQVIKKIGYLPTRFVHNGPFSRIYIVKNDNGLEYIAKVESGLETKKTLGLEARVYQACKGVSGFAKLYRCAKVDKSRVLIMEKLGTDLSRICRILPEKRFSMVDSLKICLKTFCRIWSLHQHGWFHRDIKLSNFLFGMPPDDNIYIADFGLARPIIKDIRARPHGECPLVGTAAYQSIATHNRMEYRTKDDLESWFYLCVHLITGTLPWMDTPKELMVDFKKFCTTSGRHLLVEQLPPQYNDIFDVILSSGDMVDYYKISALLKSACCDQGEERLNQPFPWKSNPSIIERALQLESEN